MQQAASKRTVLMYDRISCTICMVGYFILTTIISRDCAAVSVMIPIAESITLFTSCALLAIRVWVVYRSQLYVTALMVTFMCVSVAYSPRFH